MKALPLLLDTDANERIFNMFFNFVIEILFYLLLCRFDKFIVAFNEGRVN